LRGESAKLEQDIENAKRRKLQCEEEITKHEGKSSSFDADSTQHAKELEEMRKKEIEFNNRIRELQKKQQECEKETQKLKTDLEGMDSKLSHGMPHGTARAIRFLDDFCQQHRVIKPRARCRRVCLLHSREPISADLPCKERALAFSLHAVMTFCQAAQVRTALAWVAQAAAKR
jgi:hypothetical protein